MKITLSLLLKNRCAFRTKEEWIALSFALMDESLESPRSQVISSIHYRNSSKILDVLGHENATCLQVNTTQILLLPYE